MAYNTLVRPVLKYAPTVWDPYTKTNIEKVGMVQRRAARYALHSFHNTSIVTGMLNKLQWQSLEERRRQQRLAIMDKVHHGQVAINMGDHLVPTTRKLRYQHKFTYHVTITSVDYTKFSFFPRTATDWNLLPYNIVTASTLDIFRARPRSAPHGGATF